MDTFKDAGLRELDVTELGSIISDPFQRIGSQWFLLTAGDERGYNTMTASWGFAGVMWGKNSFCAVVRPQRYTKGFLDKFEYFTVSFLPEKYRDALRICGSKSGRDIDKAAETGLTPVFGEGVTAFEQAELVLVCKKQFVQPMEPGSFADKSVIDSWYAAGDFHVEYMGEIVKAYVKGAPRGKNIEARSKN